MSLFEFRICTGNVRCHTILVVARNTREACAILDGNLELQTLLANDPGVERPLQPEEKPLTGIISWTSSRE